VGELIRSRQHQVACRALAPASTTRVILPPLGSLHLRLPLEVLLKEKPFIFHFPLLQLSVATRMLLPSGLSLLLFPVALPSSLLSLFVDNISIRISMLQALIVHLELLPVHPLLFVYCHSWTHHLLLILVGFG
jgi:hypothetical protein